MVIQILHAQTWCRPVHARGFIAGQKTVENQDRATGPSWAAGPSPAVGRGQLGLRAAGSSRAVGRGPVFSKAPLPLLIHTCLFQLWYSNKAHQRIMNSKVGYEIRDLWKKLGCRLNLELKSPDIDNQHEQQSEKAYQRLLEGKRRNTINATCSLRWCYGWSQRFGWEILSRGIERLMQLWLLALHMVVNKLTVKQQRLRARDLYE